VLTLLDRYPTAAKLAAARSSSLEKIPIYLMSTSPVC